MFGLTDVPTITLFLIILISVNHLFTSLVKLKVSKFSNQLKSKPRN